jgi:hypothetical protein
MIVYRIVFIQRKYVMFLLYGDEKLKGKLRKQGLRLRFVCSFAHFVDISLQARNPTVFPSNDEQKTGRANYCYKKAGTPDMYVFRESRKMAI